MVTQYGRKKMARTLPFILNCFILGGLFIIQLFHPPDALAFKMNTHVWVAQQVLNDVIPDGKVTIPPFGEFTVETYIWEALRQYPNEFRMGSIGPDGFPDLVGGQMTAHPGVDGGWKTDDWLRHLLTRLNTLQEVAFVYGYLVHAATDVMSHSYVNTYSGDVFDLKDEQESELRHIALEDYIISRTPPLQDHTGAYLNIYDVVEAPASFLTDTLILNPTVADEFDKEVVTRYLSSMYRFWEKQGEIITEIDNIIAVIDGKIGEIQGQIDGLIDRIEDLKDIKVTIKIGPIKKTVKLYPAYCVVDPATCLLIESLEWSLEGAKASLEPIEWLNDITLGSIREPIEF